MYRGISNLDAAKLLAGDSGAKYTPRPRTPTAEEQREASAKEYRRIMHDSNATMSARIEVVGSGADIMEDEAFGKALNAYWWASDNLDNLDARTEVERLEGWCGRHGCD